MFDSFGFPFAATQIMWVGAIAHMCYGMKKVAHWSETTSNGVWVQFWRLVGRHAEIYSLMHSKKNICGFCLSWFSDVGSRTIFFNANHVESIDAYNGWPVKYFEYWRNVFVQLFLKLILIRLMNVYCIRVSLGLLCLSVLITSFEEKGLIVN